QLDGLDRIALRVGGARNAQCKHGRQQNAGADHSFLPCYSPALMPVTLTISAQRGASSAISAENSATVEIRGSMPSLARLARTSSVLSPSFIAALSAAITGAGVPVGATMPKIES